MKITMERYSPEGKLVAFRCEDGSAAFCVDGISYDADYLKTIASSVNQTPHDAMMRSSFEYLYKKAKV